MTFALLVSAQRTSAKDPLQGKYNSEEGGPGNISRDETPRALRALSASFGT